MNNSELDLAEYVRRMLNRHSGLSAHRASLQAGLAGNVVTKILSRQTLKPRPATLKALARTWGTPEDYREMMRLAGHPLPTPFELAEISPLKRRAIELLSNELVGDHIAAIIVAVLEAWIAEKGSRAGD